ncbi:ParB/RepB/Spo0J family partition protein [Actinomadura keratinilytica]|uniref:ParB N-terminal domain-containing protein n=1 Tax=Actinomadura keratinilytica TaxID=547461 RepID=A0ABP7ZG35_9ACTN
MVNAIRLSLAAPQGGSRNSSQTWNSSRWDTVRQTVETVAVDALAMDDSPRCSGVVPEHVAALAETPHPLPPIIVHRATMRVIDGRHRLLAARMRGRPTIDVRFYEGDEAHAFALAVKSNIAHGLPLTAADRKRAAARVIASHPQWSDRLIASVTGLAPATVADIRRRSAAGSAERIRIGRDGRIRPVDATEGRRRAGELILADPSLSLRQIARAAGISPETARDVRNRLRRGEDPLPSRRRRKRTAPARPDAPKPEPVGAVGVKPAGAGGARPAGAAGPGARIDHLPVRDRLMAVERLRADPALRFNEAGRALLRLLAVHTISAEQWDRIVQEVPAHCAEGVARAADECARAWAEFADRLEGAVARDRSA